jgi:hypothetical protein
MRVRDVNTHGSDFSKVTTGIRRQNAAVLMYRPFLMFRTRRSFSLDCLISSSVHKRFKGPIAHWKSGTL